MNVTQSVHHFDYELLHDLFSFDF